MRLLWIRAGLAVLSLSLFVGVPLAAGTVRADPCPAGASRCALPPNQPRPVGDHEKCTGASADLRVPETFEQCSETGDAELRSAPNVRDLPTPPQSTQAVMVPGNGSSPQAHG
ncbi:hypothetical protein [Mycobacteroides franklinii]|uniref:Intersectin-EH binding protein Ibp1 n=1 Tax=Mycobacteroides franklinii TaxID=948102 RepID=A0A4R8R6N1_9MYCO|nr:hypothetical protein [Mycobacteroides franklinii]TDZ41774.1 hypothetical protein CCUG64054_01807 [Mycobacteroides franklinii]TDZ51922.1 hypothetical protein CCUG63697_00392 [Mycobacteroides franklinii]TDZ55329.1 hypothetical protein CCUG63696_01810 [Mycobacteroides franklinii]TDZ62270.1 hypothetical protein CCUG63695_01734 [Mycobacteroides franklinii]TDZ68667.1 hypothetical protein CCUG64056_01807 [Mycobacteroides franklinii]